MNKTKRKIRDRVELFLLRLLLYGMLLAVIIFAAKVITVMT